MISCFAFFIWLYLHDLSGHLVHVDEGAWAYLSLFKCKLLLIDKNWDYHRWEDRYFHDLPPIASYLIGLSAWLHGYMDTLTPEKPFELTPEETEKVIPAARIPMAILGGASCILFFWLCMIQNERLASYICAFMLAFNTLMLRTCRRAMSESPFVFFMVLSIGFSILWIKALNRSEIIKSFLYAGLTGTAVALSTGSKLLGVFILPAIVITNLVNSITMYHIARRNEALRKCIKKMIWMWATTVCCFCTWFLVFYASYPTFYGHPLKNMWEMVTYRQDLIKEQWRTSIQTEVGNLNPYGDNPYRGFIQHDGKMNYSPQIQTLRDRFHLVFFRSIMFYGTIQGMTGMVLDLPFLILGFMVIIRKSLLDWRNEQYSFNILIISWFIVLYIALSITLPLDWDRYYLIVVPPATFLSGLGVAYFLRILWYRILKIIR